MASAGVTVPVTLARATDLRQRHRTRNCAYDTRDERDTGKRDRD